jgi:hypothetical protein
VPSAGGSCRPATRPDRQHNRYVCARAQRLYARITAVESIGVARLDKTALTELFAVLKPVAFTATAQAVAEADSHFGRG